MIITRGSILEEIYQARDAVFHQQMRRELKIRRAAEYFWRTSNVCRMLDITSQTKWFLEGEIKDAKRGSFLPDFQTLFTIT